MQYRSGFYMPRQKHGCGKNIDRKFCCCSRQCPKSPHRKALTSPVHQLGLQRYPSVSVNKEGIAEREEIRRAVSRPFRSFSAVPAQSFVSKDLERKVRFDVPKSVIAPSDPNTSGFLRHNDAFSVKFMEQELKHPFREGNIHRVCMGVYTAGPRKGERCVGKWLKESTVFEKNSFKDDIATAQMAGDIIQRFNQSKIIDKTIRMNIPEVWMFTKNNLELSGTMFLCEPFVNYFQSFNPKTGIHDETKPWSDVMQALSHFSYHTSNGEYLLCDLQGGVYRDFVLITDPVILSRTLQFGVSDLGPEAIMSFFHQHHCTVYCSPKWTKPVYTKECYEPAGRIAMKNRQLHGLRRMLDEKMIDPEEDHTLSHRRTVSRHHQ